MKSFHKYFILLSIVFLVIALYKADFLTVPEIHSKSDIALSFFFLFLGFAADSFSWYMILKHSTYDVRFRVCLAGTGLSIFGKYIPGKIWMIVGRASYAAEHSPYQISKLSLVSLNAQFITLWIGLVLGGAGLFIFNGFGFCSGGVLFLWGVLTVIIFSRIVHNTAEKLVRVILRRRVTFPALRFVSTVSVMPWFALIWIFFSFGFYFLVRGLSLISVPYAVGLGFPLAGTLGIMAIIFPGGIGVREGIMMGYLTLFGIPLAEATAISIAARLWFCLGELFIFSLGLAVHSSAKKIERNLCP